MRDGRPGATSEPGNCDGAHVEDFGGGRSTAELEWICRAALESAYSQFREVQIRAAFHPYVGLTHTIRRRGPAWTLRISDHCRHAPRIVLEAIARLLGAKVLRRKPPVEIARIYERFRRDPSVVAALHERRLKHGRKRIAHPRGKHHSLHDVLEELNARHFNGQVEITRIGWGTRRSWGQLGHYDPVHRTITISPVLNAQNVPAFVVAFLVFHEMLHALFEGTGPEHRRHHPPHFQRAERAHPDYARARKFLTAFCASRGKSGGADAR